MTDITKLSTAGVDAVSAQKGLVISQLFAGEALAKADACYIDSDGLVYKAVSTHCTVSGIADFVGFTNKAYAVGQACELFGRNNVLGYAAAITPGAFYWVSSNAGLLATAKVANVDNPVAMAISVTDILVIK